MMPDAWLVLFFCITTAIGLFRESRKKIDPKMRAQWAAMAIPFLYLGGAFFWVALSGPSPEDRTVALRWGTFAVVACATFFLWEDFIEAIFSKIKTIIFSRRKLHG